MHWQCMCCIDQVVLWWRNETELSQILRPIVTCQDSSSHSSLVTSIHDPLRATTICPDQSMYCLQPSVKFVLSGRSGLCFSDCPPNSLLESHPTATTNTLTVTALHQLPLSVLPASNDLHPLEAALKCYCLQPSNYLNAKHWKLF